MNRTAQAQSQHDKMVLQMASYLESKQYGDIRADHIGLPQPETVQWQGAKTGRIPDVTAGSPSFVIVEVETADSINDAHTEDQWKLFAAKANRLKGAFWIAVPDGFQAAAEKRRDQLGLTAKVFTVKL